MSEHYFSDATPSTDDQLRLLQIQTRSFDLQMWVSNRVFSTSRLDPGTTELLKAVPPLSDKGPILDLGCGWGPVAVAAALEAPNALIWAVDVNSRALALTARNAQVNGASNVWTATTEIALDKAKADGVKFHTILSNPPVRIGKKAMHNMLSQWLEFLAIDGTAWLVMNKNLGGDSLIKWLSTQGYKAEKFASRKGFRIIRVTN